jgi:integrase
MRPGMRLGELLGLKWGDIDWNAKWGKLEKMDTKVYDNP